MTASPPAVSKILRVVTAPISLTLLWRLDFFEERRLWPDVHRSFVGVGRSDELEPRVVSEYVLELASVLSK
jgi:hypothetical protein